MIIILAVFLRVWKVDKVPVSLFGDELDVGYQAYSILKTGRDYNGNFMPLHFQSMAEWRTPLYLYSCVPTVFIFGISPLGVRLPAIIVHQSKRGFGLMFTGMDRSGYKALQKLIQTWKTLHAKNKKEHDLVTGEHPELWYQ